MKKVLIITYYWPPSGGGGVQRWLKFVKYLRLFNWEPIVFAPSNPEMPSVDLSLLDEIPSGVRVITNKIWEPYAVYKRFTGRNQEDKIQTAFLSEKKSKFHLLEDLAVWIRGNFFIPDARRFWIKPSVRQLSQLLTHDPVDILVTTGPPHSVHLIGMHLSKKFGIPWLADFRDPWTNIDFYRDLKLGKRADRIHHLLERQVLETAHAVTVVSAGMKREFVTIVNRSYEVIPNGFDEEDFRLGFAPEPDTFHFTLAHIGSLTRTRNAENLWRVLKELTESNAEFANRLKLRNVGKIDVHVVESLQKFGLDKYLNRIDYIPHKEVIAEQHKASVLLLLVNNTPNARLILTGKLFEYLASGRPIVCIGPPEGDAAKIVQETQCGTVFDFKETEGLKKQILSLFQNFVEGKVHSGCKGVDQFERKNLTARMADIMEEISR